MEAIGQFFFRTRNLLFPIALGLILVAFPPVALDGPLPWTLLACGGALVVLGQALRIVTIGLAYIKRGGRGRRIFAEGLVTGGIFGHCRNPMYVGNLSFLLGLLLVAGNPWAIVTGGGFFVLAYVSIVRAEERYLAGRFGSGFAEYCAHVPRWLPRLRGLAGTLGSTRFDWIKVVEKEYGTIFVSMVAPAGLLAWKTVRGGGWAALEPWLPAYGAYLGVATVLYVVARVLKKSGRLRSGPATRTMASMRARIDDLDGRLLCLLNERAALVETVFERKKADGASRYDRERTEAILRRLREINEGPLTDEEVERLYTGILQFFAFEFRRGAAPELEIIDGAAQSFLAQGTAT
jgi:protein-S-isoprenylcysteine O-methyltransferase Ste14/chorismate mutase